MILTFLIINDSILTGGCMHVKPLPGQLNLFSIQKNSYYNITNVVYSYKGGDSMLKTAILKVIDDFEAKAKKTASNADDLACKVIRAIVMAIL